MPNLQHIAGAPDVDWLSCTLDATVAWNYWGSLENRRAPEITGVLAFNDPNP